MVAGGSSEELVSTYQTTWRHIPDHSNFHSDCGQLSTLHRAIQVTIIGLHKHTMEVWVGLEEHGRLWQQILADVCRAARHRTNRTPWREGTLQDVDRQPASTSCRFICIGQGRQSWHNVHTASSLPILRTGWSDSYSWVVLVRRDSDSVLNNVGCRLLVVEAAVG
jgi:hypothetical protein